jgi:hypothetical protein
MKLRLMYNLTSWVIPIICIILFFIFKWSFLALGLFISWLIGVNLKCPKCHTRICSFFYYKSEYGRIKILPDKCPHCDCVWE